MRGLALNLSAALGGCLNSFNGDARGGTTNYRNWANRGSRLANEPFVQFRKSRKKIVVPQGSCFTNFGGATRGRVARRSAAEGYEPRNCRKLFFGVRRFGLVWSILGGLSKAAIHHCRKLLGLST
jgi:hypothetical protein